MRFPFLESILHLGFLPLEINPHLLKVGVTFRSDMEAGGHGRLIAHIGKLLVDLALRRSQGLFGWGILLFVRRRRRLLGLGVEGPVRRYRSPLHGPRGF